ncbi:hypothetical protein [Paradesertivirga mongoliensis]|uniref:hypothetical protein n=1 Tax=Paradesertivirga mongoliensis TaxID=2100740 RepID=UPI00210E6F53|nr:hypothetical protein [Pedobacter mongoliensis]
MNIHILNVQPKIFHRVRGLIENRAEFGRAGKAGKLLRRSMRLLMQNASDKRVTARMTQEMMRVLG